MIQPLRRHHFRIWIVITIAAWTIFAMALMRRETATPRNPELTWEKYR